MRHSSLRASEDLGSPTSEDQGSLSGPTRHWQPAEFPNSLQHAPMSFQTSKIELPELQNLQAADPKLRAAQTTHGRPRWVGGNGEAGKSATVPLALAGVFGVGSCLALRSAFPKCLSLARSALRSPANLCAIELTPRSLCPLWKNALPPRRGHTLSRKKLFYHTNKQHPPPRNPTPWGGLSGALEGRKESKK